MWRWGVGWPCALAAGRRQWRRCIRWDGWSTCRRLGGWSMALYLTEDDVAGLLTMDTALEAVEEAFFTCPRAQPSTSRAIGFPMAGAPSTSWRRPRRAWGHGPQGLWRRGRTPSLLGLPPRHRHGRAHRPDRGQRHGQGAHRGRQRRRYQVHGPRRREHRRHDRLRLPGEHPVGGRLQGERHHRRQGLLADPREPGAPRVGDGAATRHRGAPRGERQGVRGGRGYRQRHHQRAQACAPGRVAESGRPTSTLPETTTG